MTFVANNFRWGGVERPIGVGPATFSPFEIGWAEAWWADDPGWSSRPGNGASVTTWPSGVASRNATLNGSDINTMNTSNSAFNSKATVRFPASGNSVLATSAFTLTPPYDIVAIVAREGSPWHSNGQMAVGLGGSPEAGLAVQPDFWYYFTNWPTLVQGAAMSTGTAQAVRMRPTTSGTTFKVGGSSYSTGNAGTTTTVGVGLGGHPNSSNPGNCSLAFVGYFNGDLTADSKWSAFVSWVSSYYGLTLS